LIKLSKKNDYICTCSLNNAEALWVEAEWWGPIYWNSVLDALCLTHRNLAVPN